MDSNENILTEANFLLFCSKHYCLNNRFFNDSEFQEDIARIKYIKRLLNKYIETGEIRERLILNHITVLNNVFGPFCTTRMLFLKLKGYETLLKPFCEFLSILPDVIVIGIPRRMIVTRDIESNKDIERILQDL
jgi:DNA-binding transcriptional MerR regulator